MSTTMEDYGYCYQPEVADGTGRTLGFSPAGNRRDWEPHPYYTTPDEAEAWLRARVLRGEVLRYCHHEPPERRTVYYRPCFTVEVVARTEGMTLSEYSPAYRRAAAWTGARLCLSDPPIENHTTQDLRLC